MPNNLTLPESPISFEHRGTKIVVTSKGRFVAIVAGQRISLASLDGMKKRIDELGKFEPFDAWVELHGYQTNDVVNPIASFNTAYNGRVCLVSVRIVGFSRAEGKFIDAAGQPQYRVLEANEANKAAWTNWMWKIEQRDAAVAEANIAIDHAEKRIVWRLPNEE